MKEEKVYLKQNVVMEPLFNQWYAWSYLIAPATASMYVANSHLKIMQSFISAPQAHVNALKNPAMAGGPFINYDERRVNDVKALMEKTVREQAHLLKLAEAIKALEAMLANEAKGFSLEPVYQKVPEALRGYIEIFYDINGYPSFRFIERLLYESPFYNESSQSLTLSLTLNDGRPFVFSTPRFEDQGQVHIRKEFKSEGVDELSKMKTAAQSYCFIRDLLKIRPDQGETFGSLFTQDPSPVASEYDADDIRIRYFGHACLLVETRGISLLVDPVIGYKYGADAGRYTYADLPTNIDYVLITHNHQDHCLFEALLQLRHKIKNIIVPKGASGSLLDPSLRLVLEKTGFKSVKEIDELESINIESGAIVGLPFLGEHADLNIRTKIAYLINLKGRFIVCAADSNNIEPRLYDNIHRLTGDIDLIFLGMECVGGPLTWLYGPLLTRPIARKMDQSRRLNGSNCEKALNIIEALKPKQVYVYAMGLEPWLSFLTSLQYTEESVQIVESARFIGECQKRGIISERLYRQREIILAPN